MMCFMFCCRLPLTKEDCDVLNALQRDPEGENEVLYPNQYSLGLNPKP